MRRGLTLVELLAAMAIAVLLVAVVIPVLSRSKREAIHTDDLARLKQLGVANALYIEQHGEGVRSCTTLVDLKLVPEVLCGARADATQEGWVHAVRNNPDRGFPMFAFFDQVPYKLTFVGRRELKVQPVEDDDKAAATCENAGWLLDFTMSEEWEVVTRWSYPGRGLYRRVLNDGSVAKRNVVSLFEPSSDPNVAGKYHVTIVQFYFDCPESFLWEQIQRRRDRP